MSGGFPRALPGMGWYFQCMFVPLVNKRWDNPSTRSLGSLGKWSGSLSLKSGKMILSNLDTTRVLSAPLEIPTRYTSHIPLIFISYSSHIPLIFLSYSSHISLIFLSYSSHISLKSGKMILESWIQRGCSPLLTRNINKIFLVKPTCFTLFYFNTLKLN